MLKLYSVIQLRKLAVNLCSALLGSCKLGTLPFGTGSKLLFTGFQYPTQKFLFIHLCLSRQILYSGQNVGVEVVIADIVCGADTADLAKLSVRGTVEIAVRFTVLLVCAEAH